MGIENIEDDMYQKIEQEINNTIAPYVLNVVENCLKHSNTKISIDLVKDDTKEVVGINTYVNKHYCYAIKDKDAYFYPNYIFVKTFTFHLNQAYDDEKYSNFCDKILKSMENKITAIVDTNKFTLTRGAIDNILDISYKTEVYGDEPQQLAKIYNSNDSKIIAVYEKPAITVGSGKPIKNYEIVKKIADNASIIANFMGIDLTDISYYLSVYQESYNNKKLILSFNYDNKVIGAEKIIDDNPYYVLKINTKINKGSLYASECYSIHRDFHKELSAHKFVEILEEKLDSYDDATVLWDEEKRINIIR